MNRATIGLGTLLAVTISIGILAAGYLAPLMCMGLVVCSLAYFAPLKYKSIVATGLVILLAGYAFGGRGFAYIGISPIFVGEVVLALGVVLLMSKQRMHLAGGSNRLLMLVSTLLLALVAWCAASALKSFPSYGLATARDSAIWLYALFVPIVYILVSNMGRMNYVIRQYIRMSWVLPAWSVVVALFLRSVELPRVPGSDVAIIALKSGDVGVHLAGIGAFALLGLLGFGKRLLGWNLAFWSLWILAVVAAASINRGGFVAMVISLLVLLAQMRLRRVLGIVVTALLLVGTLGVTVFPLLDVETNVNRSISSRQLVENVASLVGVGGGSDSLNATANWRLDWWGKIVQYTFAGPHFWMGKGFGVNLADSDGFQVLADGSLRSPHNGHLTFLARAGVPALILWISFLLALILSLLVHGRRLYYSEKVEARTLGKALLWTASYAIASSVNASFDVYLEGPQGGIWFWCIVGFGLALLRLASRTNTSSNPRDLHLFQSRGAS